MVNENLHSKHRERLRERYLKDGIDSFEPHQVLELILFYAIPRKDTNGIAHALLNRFGSLANVLEAPVEELATVEGIGKSTAVYLNMFSQVIRKYEQDKAFKRKRLSDYASTGEFCLSLFKGRVYECMFLISLNSQNRVINYEKVAEGTVNETTVYPRELIRSAISNHAVKVVVAHNHPGGTATPSTDDIHLTTLLRNAFNAVGIEFCDHIIVSGEEYTSCI